MQVHRTIKFLAMACLLMIGKAWSQPVKTFVDTRIVHGHSVDVGRPGSLKFVIGHRFGALNGGVYEFFGIDQATTRLSLDYTQGNRLAFGLGRSSYLKTFDGYLKYNLMRQSGGNKNWPVSMTWMSNMTLSAMRWTNPDRRNYFTSRLGYAHQLLIARKLGNRWSVQLAPTVVHRNIVYSRQDRHDIFSLNAAARFKLSESMGLNAECFYLPQGQLPPESHSAFSLGFDVKTDRHAFQVFVSNSRGMVERYIITETTGDLLKGDLFIGFNMSRDFQLKR